MKTWEAQSEARPSKKRKVGVDKGKGKAKVEVEPEFSLWEVVEELQGLREDLWEFQKEFRHAVRVGDQVASQLRKVNTDLNDLADFFMTRESDDEEEQGEGYDKGVEGTWGRHQKRRRRCRRTLRRHRRTHQKRCRRRPFNRVITFLQCIYIK